MIIVMAAFRHYLSPKLLIMVSTMQEAPLVGVAHLPFGHLMAIIALFLPP